MENITTLTFDQVFKSKTKEEQDLIAKAFTTVCLNPDRDLECELNNKVSLTEEEVHAINMEIIRCRYDTTSTK